MSILRSFMVVQGAQTASFTADVEEFLGIVPGPGGALLLTLCRGYPENRPTLLGANGLALPSRQGDEWHIHVLTDGMEPPPGARYVGGLGAQTMGGPMGLFFWARLATVDAVPVSEIPDER